MVVGNVEIQVVDENYNIGTDVENVMQVCAGGRKTGKERVDILIGIGEL